MEGQTVAATQEVMTPPANQVIVTPLGVVPAAPPGPPPAVAEAPPPVIEADGAKAPDRPKTVEISQGVYYLLVGLWPFLSAASFQHVMGEHADLPLLRTLGLVLAVIGASLLSRPAAAASRRNRWWSPRAWRACWRSWTSPT